VALDLLEARTGREEEVEGRMVSAGRFGFLDDEVWMCSRWRNPGRLGGVVVVDGESSDA
jgi:hypothetical protein